MLWNIIYIDYNVKRQAWRKKAKKHKNKYTSPTLFYSSDPPRGLEVLFVYITTWKGKREAKNLTTFQNHITNFVLPMRSSF